MKYVQFLSLTAVACALAASQPALAAGAFECPAKPLAVPQDARVQAALPTGNAFQNVDALNASVDKLRTEGVNPILIIDGLITAYCPVIAAETQWTDAQKATRFNRFAARVTRTVYSLDGADEVILDVPFPPAIVDAINTKAKAAGISAQDWVRTAVDGALK